MWLAAVEALVACAAPMQRLLDRLLVVLSGRAAGPLEVRAGVWRTTVSRVSNGFCQGQWCRGVAVDTESDSHGMSARLG